MYERRLPAAFSLAGRPTKIWSCYLRPCVPLRESSIWVCRTYVTLSTVVELDEPHVKLRFVGDSIFWGAFRSSAEVVLIRVCRREGRKLA
jgi:hypothetical protein